MSSTSYHVIDTGGSRSFPEFHSLIEQNVAQAVTDAVNHVDVVIVIGKAVSEVLDSLLAVSSIKAIVLELGAECLGVHTGEDRGTEGNHVLGFARFRMGDDPPSDLVELVRQPQSHTNAIESATAVFNQASLAVSLCFDQSGRILDRLLRPYFNDVLRRLDEGLASADDMDLTLKLGLGYPEGPITLLERSGLHHHATVSKALFDTYGSSAFNPGRRATVARVRRGFDQSKDIE